MKNIASKPQLTLEAIMSALHPMDVSLAQDSDLIAGAKKALEQGLNDAEAALSYAIAWRSGFRDGRAALGYKSAEPEQDPETKRPLDADAIRKTERERIKAIVEAVPTDKFRAALAIALNSDLPTGQAIDALHGLPMPQPSQISLSVPLNIGLRAKDAPGGLVTFDALSGSVSSDQSTEGNPMRGSAAAVPFMGHDPLVRPDPVKDAWATAIARVNAEQARRP